MSLLNQKKSKLNSLLAGAGWVKTDKFGGQYISLKFSGKAPEDEVEVVLRVKDSQQELALFDTPVMLIPNTKKKTEKHPDWFFKVLYE